MLEKWQHTIRMVNKICQGICVDIQLLVSTEVCAAIETLLPVPALPSLKRLCIKYTHTSGLSLDTELSLKLH